MIQTHKAHEVPQKGYFQSSPFQLPLKPPFYIFMSMPYEPKGLHGLLPQKSKSTGEEIRFTSLAGQYSMAPSATAPAASMMPPSSQLAWSSSGMMSLDGFAAFQVSTLSSTYVKREFPEEVYCQVKRHVSNMVNHPHEKTMKYKIDCVREGSRRFLNRLKWKSQRCLRGLSVRVRRP